MTWLDDGTPAPHPCALPGIERWSMERPEEGYEAEEDDSRRHVHPGARWQCVICDTIHRLNADGSWEREQQWPNS